MESTNHLVVLHERLAHEKVRLAKATTQSEIDLRSVWIRQIEKEIDGEIKFLAKKGPDVIFMDDEALLRELGV